MRGLLGGAPIKALLGQSEPQPLLGGSAPAPANNEEAQWMAGMQANLARNQQWAKPGPAMTTLDPAQEAQFRGWVQQAKVPFNLNDPVSDYDMRGYWKDIASQGASERARNQFDGEMHFPDTYKTPYHESFSRESKYAQPTAPYWVDDRYLVTPQGQVVFDAAKRRPEQ